MIQTGPAMRILVATQPVDFRKGIDSLAAICRQQLEQDVHVAHSDASGGTAIVQANCINGGHNVNWLFDETPPNAPALSSTTPAHNATGVAVDANLVLTFSEAVIPGSGNIIVKNAVDDSTIEAISVTSGQVTGGGSNTITVSRSVTLDAASVYYVLINATAFEDSAGNSYAGISSTKHPTRYRVCPPADPTRGLIGAISAASSFLEPRGFNSFTNRPAKP